MLNEKLKSEIAKHAAAEVPRESCGFIVRHSDGLTYLPCPNVSQNPEETFEISSDDWVRAEESGTVEAVVHSHPDGEPYLSGADRQSQIASGLPWVLYTGSEFKVFRCVPHVLGREFVYGEYDCAAAVRDTYMLGGLDLPDCERQGVEEDVKTGALLAHCERTGFIQVSDGLRVGDVLVTEHGGFPSHVCVYLGDEQILHHAIGQLCARESYGEQWRRHTHSVWRHSEWKPEMIRGLLNDMESFGEYLW